jgi:hypothetical protein
MIDFSFNVLKGSFSPEFRVFQARFCFSGDTVKRVMVELIGSKKQNSSTVLLERYLKGTTKLE